MPIHTVMSWLSDKNQECSRKDPAEDLNGPALLFDNIQNSIYIEKFILVTMTSQTTMTAFDR